MKRIILMLALTALLVLALSMSALSAFAKCPQSANCSGPGKSLDSGGASAEKNPQVKFVPGSAND
jgi:hypothetical protein